MQEIKAKPDDLDVQVAIVTDIAATSPQAFPALAGIISHLISHAATVEKSKLWERVADKMKRIPHNGYLEIWLQRVTVPLEIPFDSDELVCRVVNGEAVDLWNSDWINNEGLKAAVKASKILVEKPKSAEPVMDSDEVKLFTFNAEFS